MQDALFIFVTAGGRLMALLCSGETVDVAPEYDLIPTVRPPIINDQEREYFALAA